MFKPVLITAFVATFGLAGVNATATQALPTDAPKVLVSYADINTATPKGAAVLRNRIQRAAEQVCGGRPSATIHQTTQFDPCVKEVTARTLAGMKNTQLAVVVGRTVVATNAN